MAKHIDSKMPSNSTSEHPILKIFLPGYAHDAPRPPSATHPNIVLHTITHNHSCTIKLYLDYVAWPQAPSYAP